MGLAALLAGVAGYVDANCVLVLGGPFAANMTGNLVRLGMGAAEGKWDQAAWCFLIVAAFFIGVLISRLVVRIYLGPQISLSMVAGLIALAGAGWLGWAAVPVLAAAMAMQNEAVRHGMVAVNVAFVTGDLQKLGERLVAGTAGAGRPGHGGRIILAVLGSYALGAGMGTLAAPWHAPGLFIPAACLVAAVLMPRRLTGLVPQRH